jgi:hypothetical protein
MGKKGWKEISFDLKEIKSTEMQDTKRIGDVFCPASKNCGNNFALSFL